MFFVPKTFFSQIFGNVLGIYPLGREISITQGATLLKSLKSLSIVDIFLKIFSKFRNKFIKDHLRNAASAVLHQVKITSFYLNSPLQFSEDSSSS